MIKKNYTRIFESSGDVFTAPSQKDTPIDAEDLEMISGVVESAKRRNIKEHDEVHEESEGYDWNEGHPDHEGEMAVSQLHRIAEMAEMLLDIIGEDDDLPGWVQYKLGRAYNDMSDLFGYIESKSHDLHDESDEGFEFEDEYPLGDMEADELEELEEGKKKGLLYWMNRRKKKGLPPHKPGEKGYPSKEAWKTVTGESVRRTIRELIKKELKG